MLTNPSRVIVCVKVGTKYGPEYVNNLEAMVKRHTHHPYSFVCLTDNPTGINGTCIVFDSKAPSGWWAKLKLFDPHCPLAASRRLFLDLDTVIIGSLDPLLAFDGDFAILRDFYYPEHYGSAIMSIAPNFGAEIWKAYNKDRKSAQESFWGDQEWIEHILGHPPQVTLWQNYIPNYIGSYKADNLQEGPKHFSIVCFHGEPKPLDVQNGWIGEHWNVAVTV